MKAAKPLFFGLSLALFIVPLIFAQQPQSPGGATQGAPATQNAPLPPLEGWGNNLNAAIQQAGQENRQILVYFSSSNIPPSRAMTEQVLSRPRLMQFLDPFVLVQIDVDQQAETAGKFKVNQLPVFAVLDSQGREIDRFGGFLPEGAFAETLRSAANPRLAVPVLQKRIADNPGDMEALWLLAQKYARDKKREELDKTLIDMRKRDPENQKGFLDNVAFLEMMTSVNPKVPQDGVAAAEQFLEEFPDSEFADQVDLARAQLAFQAGDVNKSIQVLEEFSAKHPDSPLARQVANDLRTIRAQAQAKQQQQPAQ